MTFDGDEPGKIFVGGLNWETTKESLQGHFSRYGEVVDCIIMKNNETGQPRGFGFVTFKDPAVIDCVLAAGPHTLDGKTIDPKVCTKRSAQKVNISAKDSDALKAFLGGLPIEISEEEVAKAFSKFGNVTDVTIMIDPEKQKSRGFGFLTFETQEALQLACREHYVDVNGKKVECKAAMPRNARPPPRSARAPYQLPASRQGANMAQQQQPQQNSWYPQQGAYPAGGAAAMNYPGYNMYQQAPAAYNYQGNYAGYANYNAAQPAYAAQPNYNATPAAAYTAPPNYNAAASAAYPAQQAPAQYNSSSNNNNNNYDYANNYARSESQYGPTKSHYSGEGGYGSSTSYKASENYTSPNNGGQAYSSYK